MSKPKHISLTLTDEQKASIKEATGKDAEALELDVAELEERIASARVGAGGGAITGI
jgi:hypothetical protein